MFNKYIKYKLLYKKLKGGIIDPTRDIQSNEYHILTLCEKNELISELMITENDISKLTNITFDITDIYQINFTLITIDYNILISSSEYIWTFNTDIKLLLNDKLIKNNLYSDIVNYFVAYRLIIKNKQHIDIYSKIIQQNNYITPEYDENHPYEFIPYINLFNKDINVFTNIFSEKISKDLDYIMIKWLDNILYDTREFKLLFQILREKTTIVIPDKSNFSSSFFFYKVIRNFIPFFVTLNSLNQPIIILNKPNSSIIGYRNLCKFHMTVKLENLFWTIEKLIKNINLFINKDFNNDPYNTYLIDSFKIMTNYYNYTILKDIIDQYPNSELINLVYPNYTIKDSDNRENYELETINEANIIFYIKLLPNNSQNNKKYIRQITKILMELFPDSLNIGSNLYPRFNFKINNSIYIAFGDGNEKEDEIISDKFTQPLDYNEERCLKANDKKKCDNINNNIIKISNHKLCKYDEISNQCNINNILSINKLLINTDYKYFFLNNEDEIISYLKTTDDVYEYLDILKPI